MARGKKKDNFSLEEKLEAALVPEEEQPYEVPGNWCWVIFHNIAGIKRGASPRPIKSFVTDGIGINWIKIGDTGAGKYVDTVKERITEEGAKKSVFVEKGTLLLSNSMSFGRPYILNVEGCIHDGWLAIEPTCVTNKEFLYYALLSSNWYFEKVAVGTAVRNLNSDRVAAMPIAIPPLAEQHRIVERIESLFSQLDEARDKAQEAMDGYAIWKDSLLHKAFEGGLSKKWRKLNNVKLTTWKKMSLKECSSSIGDGLHGTPTFSENGEYYFVNGNNFNGMDLLIKPDTKRVDKTEYDKYYISLSKDRTVFVSINGTLGKTAFFNNEPIILGKSACYININDNISKFYLRYFFESKEFRDYANDKATGSTIKNLGLKAMREMIMPIPSIEEQNEIVRILDSTLAMKNKAMGTLDNIIDDIELIKKSILAKAFRGEFGTNDPEEENAIELLKTILNDKKES